MVTQEEIEAFQRKHSALFRQLDQDRAEVLPDPPKQLSHYTTANGLLGIVQSNSLWATNARFLNDFSELKYGADLFREVLEESKTAIQDTLCSEHRLLERVSAHSMVAEIPSNFVVCLSENANQLSQWRAYGADGTGYSIGFDANSIRQLRWTHSRCLLLFKVCYQRDRQKELLRKLLDKFFSRIKDEGVAELKLFSSFLLARLQDYLVSFKNSAFQEEGEWRLVHTIPIPTHQKDLEFRVTGGLIVPYHVLKPAGSDFLPIESIYQGPRVAPEISEEALHCLLWRSGYNRVKDCGIPLRRHAE